MGVNDAPQWLISAFIRTCVGAGATASRPELEAAVGRLLSRWGEADRVHHNVKHLVDVLAKVDQLVEETHHPDLVRLAAWYHGAVFNSAPTSAYAQRGGEDEVASASFATTELTALGIPEAAVARVGEIIVAMARHRSEHDIDVQALCDAELATLAVEPQRYAAYRRQVREEYAHIPIRDYLTSRIAILSKLISRKRLFASPLGQPWEDPARQNLIAELQQLHHELDGLPAAADGGAAEASGAGATGSDPGTDGDASGPVAANMEDTATRLVRIHGGAGSFGRGSAEVVAAAKRDAAPVIKRHERQTSERSARQELPGRS